MTLTRLEFKGAGIFASLPFGHIGKCFSSHGLIFDTGLAYVSPSVTDSKCFFYV